MRKMLLMTSVVTTLIFLGCSSTEPPSSGKPASANVNTKKNYPVSKELHQSLHEVVSEIGAHAHDISRRTDRSTEHKKELNVLWKKSFALFMMTGQLDELLDSESIHAEEGQFSSNAMALIIGKAQGLIGVTDRNIRENSNLLADHRSDVLTDYHNKSNALLEKVAGILREVEEQLCGHADHRGVQGRP